MNSKVTGDPWVQMFAFVAIVSGALSAHALVRGWRPDAAGGGGNAQQPFAPATQTAPVVPPAPQMQSTTPQLTGPGVRKQLTPKTAGRWIVDARNGSDSDSDSLADVVFSAADKDVITLRPGTYKAPLAVAKKDLIIEGSSADEVTVESLQFNAVTVTGGELTMKSVTIAHQGPDYGSAFQVRQAKLTLSKVKVQVKGKSTGVSIDQGFFVGNEVTFTDGDPNLRADDGSDVKCVECVFSGKKTAMQLDGKGTRAELVGGKVSSDGIAVHVWTEAELNAKGTHFINSETAVMVNKKGKLTLTDVEMNDNEQGVTAGGAGCVVTATGLKAARNKRMLQIWDEAQGSLSDCTLSEHSDTAAYSMDRNSKLTVSNCRLSQNGRGLRASSGSRLEVSDTVISNTNQYGVTIGEDSVVEMKRVKIMDTANTAVYAYKRGQFTLERGEITKAGETGIFVGEDSTAVLKDVLVESSGKFGVVLDRDAKLTAEDLRSRGNRRCGLTIAAETASAKLRRTTLTKNECGIAFYVGGLIDSEDGDFTGNEKGAFMYKPENKAKITLKGPNNKTKGLPGQMGQ